MDNETLHGVLEALNELREDNTVPKNIKAKFETMITLLKEDTEDSIKINKVMHEIEQIDSDSNVEPYTRTQIFQVVSLLERV